MSKTGLFFISLGLLIFIFSANGVTGQYNILSIVTAVFLFIVGFIIIKKERR